MFGCDVVACTAVEVDVDDFVLLPPLLLHDVAISAPTTAVTASGPGPRVDACFSLETERERREVGRKQLGPDEAMAGAGFSPRGLRRRGCAPGAGG